MEDTLSKLEARIRAMIQQQTNLQSTNNQLSQGQFTLAREKKMLQEKQENAIKHIETLISRLKSIEQTS